MTRKISGWPLLLALTAMALAAGCATAPAGAPGAGLAQADTVLRGADAATQMQLLVQPNQVRIGETVRLLVSSAQAGYLYLYQVDTDGRRIVPVFPNAADGANHTRGGAMELPRPSWRLTARGPAGQGYFVAVLTAQPMDLTQVAQAAADGRIATPARYGAAMAALREVAP